MALLWFPLHIEGWDWGGSYVFTEIGDTLHEHSHDDETNHISVITDGAFDAFGRPDLDGKVLEAQKDPAKNPTIIYWAPNKMHGFRARIAGSKMMQLKIVRTRIIRP